MRDVSAGVVSCVLVENLESASSPVEDLQTPGWPVDSESQRLGDREEFGECRIEFPERIGGRPVKRCPD